MEADLLCRVSQLEEPGSQAFERELPGEEQPLEFFVVRRDGEVYAYRNRCPHTGAPLEWQPDSFLDMDGSFIECAMHGALFEMDSGLCIHGPCVGDRLQPVPLRREGDEVYLDWSALNTPS